jgi:general secretion pathway protein G
MNKNITRRRNFRRRNSRGITLIEMLVVVTIISLFVALVGVNIFKKADEAQRVAARAQIANFTNALGLFKLETGIYPPTNLGLNALRVRPDNLPQWSGPYMPQDVPLDPWGRPYFYKFPGEHGDDPDIYSLGADGELGGEGANADIVSWNNQ